MSNPGNSPEYTAYAKSIYSDIPVTTSAATSYTNLIAETGPPSEGNVSGDSSLLGGDDTASVSQSPARNPRRLLGGNRGQAVGVKKTRVRIFTPQDKVQHRNFEKSRRESYKISLIELAAVIPVTCSTEPRRLSKHIVTNEGTRYIRRLTLMCHEAITTLTHLSKERDALRQIIQDNLGRSALPDADYHQQQQQHISPNDFEKLKEMLAGDMAQLKVGVDRWGPVRDPIIQNKKFHNADTALLENEETKEIKRQWREMIDQVPVLPENAKEPRQAPAGRKKAGCLSQQQGQVQASKQKPTQSQDLRHHQPSSNIITQLQDDNISPSNPNPMTAARTQISPPIDYYNSPDRQHLDTSSLSAFLPSANPNSPAMSATVSPRPGMPSPILDTYQFANFQPDTNTPLRPTTTTTAVYGNPSLGQSYSLAHDVDIDSVASGNQPQGPSAQVLSSPPHQPSEGHAPSHEAAHGQFTQQMPLPNAVATPMGNMPWNQPADTSMGNYPAYSTPSSNMPANHGYSHHQAAGTPGQGMGIMHNMPTAAAAAGMGQLTMWTAAAGGQQQQQQQQQAYGGGHQQVHRQMHHQGQSHGHGQGNPGHHSGYYGEE